jgi:hypothetical protein
MGEKRAECIGIGRKVDLVGGHGFAKQNGLCGPKRTICFTLPYPYICTCKRAASGAMVRRRSVASIKQIVARVCSSDRISDVSAEEESNEGNGVLQFENATLAEAVQRFNAVNEIRTVIVDRRTANLRTTWLFWILIRPGSPR